MGLVDSQREQLIAKRRSLRGGVRIWLFIMLINFAAFAFAVRQGDTFFAILNITFILILGINVTMAWNEIDRINETLKEEN
jgi:hypothetical protein